MVIMVVIIVMVLLVVMVVVVVVVSAMVKKLIHVLDRTPEGPFTMWTLIEVAIL